MVAYFIMTLYVTVGDIEHGSVPEFWAIFYPVTVCFNLCLSFDYVLV